jgi:hypothetical protein
MGILTNASLTADARVVALALLQKGEGWHELPQAEVRDLLSPEAGKDRARRCVQQLERAGIIERRPGGRGHADAVQIKDTSSAYSKFRVGDSHTLNTDRVGDSHTLSCAVVVVDDVVTPLYVPPSLDERTEAVVNTLTGCRGAVRDYLLAHVPKDSRRYAYAQTVASWLNGMDASVWRLADGSALPAEERPGVLAASLNELAAGEEANMKRPVGDPGNLRTKLNVNLRKRQNYERADSGRAPAKARGDTPPARNPARERDWGDILEGAG